MRARTKQRLIRLAALACAAVGLGSIVWSITSPPVLTLAELPPIQKKALVKIELPSAGRLAPLLTKRLQGPLEPREKVVTAPVTKQKTINWPQVSLDCIFYGNDSKLAVFSANNQKFRCVEGDKVLGISVDQIARDEIHVSFRGETKTIRPQGEKRNSP